MADAPAGPLGLAENTRLGAHDDASAEAISTARGSCEKKFPAQVHAKRPAQGGNDDCSTTEGLFGSVEICLRAEEGSTVPNLSAVPSQSERAVQCAEGASALPHSACVTECESRAVHGSMVAVLGEEGCRSGQLSGATPKEEVPKEKGDEKVQVRKRKLGGTASLKANVVAKGADRRPLGGWGEKIGPDIITAFPIYEARTRQNPDAAEEDQVVRRFAIIAEERNSREGLYGRSSEPLQKLLGEGRLRKEPRGLPRYGFGEEDALFPEEESDDYDDTPRRKRGKSQCEGTRAKRRSKSREYRQREPVCEGRDTPDMRFVHDVVDNLIEEFEARPILKKQSPSPRRSSPSPGRRKLSPARTRSSPVSGRRKGPSPRGPPRRYAAVNRSSSSSVKSRDKDLERVWTVCSLLESITGDVTTEARRVYEPRAESPAFQTKSKLVNVTVSADSDDSSQGHFPKKPTGGGRKTRGKTRREGDGKARRSSGGRARPKEKTTEKRQEEPDSDEELTEPRHSYSKGGDEKRAEVEEDDAVAATSVTEISVEETAETEDVADATLEGGGRDMAASKKRKVRFFTNLVFRKRKSPAAESTQSEQQVPPKGGSREVLWRQHEEALVRTASGRIIGARQEVETSLEEEEDIEPKRRARDLDIYKDDSPAADCRHARKVPGRSYSSQIVLKVQPESHKHKSYRIQSDTEDNQEPENFSKLSKIEGLAIQVNTSLSDDDESAQEPRKRYYCQLQKPAIGEERRARILTKNKTLRVERSTDDEVIAYSESSSSVYDDRTEMRRIPSLDERRPPVAEVPDDDDQPLFRARIGRRSTMPPDEPADDEEDVPILTARIGRDGSVAGSLGRAASIVCTDSDGRSTCRFTSDIGKPADTVNEEPLPRRASSSVSIDLELPRAWSIEPCPGDTTAQASVNTLLHRPRRPSHRSRSRSRSRHRRPRYGRPLCEFRRSPQVSHAMQLLPAAAVPPLQYMCVRQPATQVYTSLSSPYSPLVAPPPMGVQQSLDIHQYSRPPTPWLCHRLPLFRRRPFRMAEGMEVPQPNPPAAAASRATMTSCGGSFATALDGAGTEASQPAVKIVFEGTTVEGPTAKFNVPTVVAAPEPAVVAEPPEQTVVCVTTTPPTSLSPMRSEECRTVEIKPSSAAHSVDDANFPESSRITESSSSQVTTVWHPRFLEHWEQDKPEVKSTSSAPRENRLYGTFMKNFTRRGHNMLYVILLVGTLAGMAAAFSIYARRHSRSVSTENDADTEGSQQPWMFGPWSQGDAAVLAAKKASCLDPSCSRQVAQLSRSLDSSVSPCENLYGHVCSVRQTAADEQLALHTESRVVSFFKGIGSPDKDLPVAAASRRLWKDCVDLATLSKLGKVPLQALLNLTGLCGWPYIQGAPLPDVWEAAGKLQRLMGLAPLIAVVAKPDGAVRLLAGDQVGLEADDVLDSMLALRRNNSRLRELAADVADLGRRLSGLRDRQQPCDDAMPRSFVETALRGMRPGTVQAEPVLGAYVRLVRESSAQAVLNLLGYRLVRHVDLLAPPAVKADLNSGALSSRESRCARLVLEQALPGDAAEYVRYASLRDRLDFGLARSMAAQLKRVLLSRLTAQRWVDAATRRSATARLRELKVRFFFDRYEGANESVLARPPTALPSQALATYQRFREARFQLQIRRGADSAAADGHQHCAYDAAYKVLFVRLSAVEVRDPESPLWPPLLAARMGPCLARCLVSALLPQGAAGVHWSAAGRARLDTLRSCLRAQRSPASMVDGTALPLAKELFDAHAARITQQGSWEQVFYLEYAHSLCEGPSRRLSQSDGPHWERVNGALANDAAFQRAFQCRPGSPMLPDKSCPFWE